DDGRQRQGEPLPEVEDEREVVWRLGREGDEADLVPLVDGQPEGDPRGVGRRLEDHRLEALDRADHPGHLPGWRRARRAARAEITTQDARAASAATSARTPAAPATRVVRAFALPALRDEDDDHDHRGDGEEPPADAGDEAPRRSAFGPGLLLRLAAGSVLRLFARCSG